LNYRTTPEALSEFLSPAGEIVDVYFATDRETGRPRGFAFVTFATEAGVTEVIRRFNGVDFEGRPLNINEARDRPSRGDPRGPDVHSGPRPPRPPRREGGFPPSRGGFEPPPPVEEPIDWELDKKRDDPDFYADDEEAGFSGDGEWDGGEGVAVEAVGEEGGGFGGGGFGGGGFGGGGANGGGSGGAANRKSWQAKKGKKKGGSRRGLRARKRSL
jgi:RNA recognition motif-containing protein